MANEKTNWHGRIEQKIDDLCRDFKNHLKHHWELTIALISITGGIMIALILALIK